MYLCRIINLSNMKKRNLLFAAILAMVMFAGLSVKAQDSVFSYAYQGTTLYYIIDGNQQARVVPPLYPDMYYNADSTESSSWYGYAQPQGAVVVPDSVVFSGTSYPVTAVEAFAFYLCDSVTSVTLPASVTYLEHDAFTLCSLETISMPGVTFMGEGCFYIAYALTSVEIPGGVTFIPEWGFDQCEALQSVTLHEGVTTLGLSCFRYCSSLQSVTFPQSLTTINDNAFIGCSSLLSLTLPSNLTSIGANAFEFCMNLQSVSFPESLTTIGVSAFQGCPSLQSVDIPGSVSNIDSWCFAQCINLSTVTLHEGTQTIGFCAFRECISLTTINYPSTLEEIGSFAFQYDSMLTTPAIFPDGLTFLGIVAYGDCSSILTASLPGSIGEVPDEVFFGCTSLKTVTIGDGITAINEQAFNHCPNIDTIYVKCAVPPTVGPSSDSTFYIYTSVLVVPCGSYDAYINNPIEEYFSEIIEDCNVGISEVNLSEITIRVANSRIEVEGAEGETVRVFDITGKQVRNEALSAGIYLVQIGNRPAEKVVVHPNM